MYIVHMLDDVRRRQLTPEALDDPRNLPTGLRAYYKFHLRVMRAKWPASLANRYETALKCLAVMREPVSIDTWTHFAPPEVDAATAHHVTREWREFLNRDWDTRNRELRYAIYHSTFTDFLDGEGAGLHPVEQAVYEAERAMLRDLLDDR